MKKISFLFKDGLRKAILTKSFLISNIIIFILLIIMLCIPNLTARVVDDSWYNRVYVVFDEENENNETIYNFLKDSETLAMMYRFDDVALVSDLEKTGESTKKGYDRALEEATAKNMHFLLYFTKTDSLDTFEVILRPIRVSDSSNLEFLKIHLENMRTLGLIPVIPPPTPGGQEPPGGDIPKPEPVEVTTDQDEKVNKVNFNKAIMLSFLISMPLLLVIGRTSHFIGTSIVDEKISRGIENILSSIPAKHHLLGKTLATMAYSAIQTLLIFAYGTIGILISDTIKVETHPGLSFIAIFEGSDAWLIVLMMFIAFMIAGMFFGVISAAISALANKQEDFLIFQVPIQIFSMIAYFLAVFSVMMSSIPTLKVLTFIPFFNAFAGPVAYVYGIVTWWHVMIGNLIAVVFIVLIYLFLRWIYEVSIMNMDSDKLPKRIHKAVKLSIANRRKNKETKNKKKRSRGRDSIYKEALDE